MKKIKLIAPILGASCVVGLAIPLFSCNNEDVILVNDIAISGEQYVAEDASIKLTATVSPADATNKDITWSIDKQSIATIDQEGNITAVSPGKAVVTAKAKDRSGIKKTYEITVTPPFEGCDGYILLGDGTPAYFDNIVVTNICSKTEEIVINGSHYERKSFNFPIFLSDDMTTIPDNFLYGCEAFNKHVNIPKKIKTLGNFMGGCKSFNQPLTLPSGITSFSNGFLSGCSRFNQPLVIPESVTSIGDYFLNACSSFNQPLTIPEGVTSIGVWFLYNSSFNQTLTLPSTLTSIGRNFLEHCEAFNQPLTLPDGLKTIGPCFLFVCKSFNQPLTLPNTLTTVGEGFMFYCDSMISSINIQDLQASVFSEDDQNFKSLATNNDLAPMYQTGIEIVGTHKQDFLDRFKNRTTIPYRNLK